MKMHVNTITTTATTQSEDSSSLTIGLINMPLNGSGISLPLCKDDDMKWCPVSEDLTHSGVKT